jgi:hypothetical protein
MSSGQFERSFYATDDGTIVPFRVQPETLAADFNGTVNDGATGPAAAGMPTASISRSRRAYGIHARYVTVAWDTAPADYDDRGLLDIHVPIKATWDAITKGSTVTYLGGTAKVVQKTPELIR